MKLILLHTNRHADLLAGSIEIEEINRQRTRRFITNIFNHKIKDTVFNHPPALAALSMRVDR
jgi:hypothetical protein